MHCPNYRNPSQTIRKLNDFLWSRSTWFRPFVSPVDQANKAAEECPHHGEDNEVSKEYEHPPPCLPVGYSLALWRMLLVQLWQGTTGQKSSLRAGGQRGESKEMQSANIKGIGSSNMKLYKYYKIQFCQTVKNKFCQRLRKSILVTARWPSHHPMMY